MPLPWNNECKERLGTNLNLSKKILNSNRKKLSRDDKLLLYDQVFKEQEVLDIFQRIDNIDAYVEANPGYSFLPHMALFKMNKETTKVRVVYLSNLCEKTKTEPDAVSHNNALLPGPFLNTKLATSLLLARFDKYMLIFDIDNSLCIDCSHLFVSELYFTFTGHKRITSTLVVT